MAGVAPRFASLEELNALHDDLTDRLYRLRCRAEDCDGCNLRTGIGGCNLERLKSILEVD